MIHFQGAFVRGNAAKFAAKFGILKNLIAQGAADITGAAPTVLPDRITASCQVLGKFSFASGFEPLRLIRCKVFVFQATRTRHCRALQRSDW